MSIEDPSLISNTGNLLLNPDSQKQPLMKNSILQLIVWAVSAKNLLQKDYQERLSQEEEEEKSQERESGIASVVNVFLIQFYNF